MPPAPPSPPRCQTMWSRASRLSPARFRTSSSRETPRRGPRARQRSQQTAYESSPTSGEPPPGACSLRALRVQNRLRRSGASRSREGERAPPKSSNKGDEQQNNKRRLRASHEAGAVLNTQAIRGGRSPPRSRGIWRAGPFWRGGAFAENREALVIITAIIAIIARLARALLSRLARPRADKTKRRERGGSSSFRSAPRPRASVLLLGVRRQALRAARCSSCRALAGR
jgi:hypothetical protein